MHLNEWTEQAERWIDLAAWDACAGPVDLEQLRGRTCFGGLDLSTTTDVTALAWVFPPEQDDGLWHLLSRYFVPEENLRKRAERDRVPYDLWTRQGFIEATPGNVVDYGAIEQRILADAALFQIKEIAYDPWNATHIALRLQDEGATMVEFRQGFRSMAAPTRELEKLIVSRKLAHGGNPVTRWMAANVAVAQDPAGNLKPAKDKSTERIDGIVAPIMAIGRAMVAQERAPARVLHVLCVKGSMLRTALHAGSCCSDRTADLHPAGGADQGQAHLMTVLAGAVDATFAAFGIDAVYTPAGGEPVSVRVIARRPDTIVGFGETRIRAETAMFELRASEVANRGPTISSPSAARPSSSRASRSGATPIGWCGATRMMSCLSARQSWRT